MTHFIKKDCLFNECVKMTKELYFADTLVSVKYNKTLKTLPLGLYESIPYSGLFSNQKFSHKCLNINFGGFIFEVSIF